jgi:hypothetical protein
MKASASPFSTLSPTQWNGFRSRSGVRRAIMA